MEAETDCNPAADIMASTAGPDSPRSKHSATRTSKHTSKTPHNHIFPSMTLNIYVDWVVGVKYTSITIVVLIYQSVVLAAASGQGDRTRCHGGMGLAGAGAATEEAMRGGFVSSWVTGGREGKKDVPRGSQGRGEWRGTPPDMATTHYTTA